MWGVGSGPNTVKVGEATRIHLTHIACVGDQLTQKHLLVRIEGVDDQAHQLRDVSCGA